MRRPEKRKSRSAVYAVGNLFVSNCRNLLTFVLNFEILEVRGQHKTEKSGTLPGSCGESPCLSLPS